jgi:hypothetical protein
MKLIFGGNNLFKNIFYNIIMNTFNLIELKKLTNKKLLDIYNDINYKKDYINAFKNYNFINDTNKQYINNICDILNQENIINEYDFNINTELLILNDEEGMNFCINLVLNQDLTKNIIIKEFLNKYNYLLKIYDKINNELKDIKRY